MEFNRNQFFIAGVVLLLLGIELRLVESFVLNEKASRYVAENMRGSSAAGGLLTPMMAAAGPFPRRVVRLPDWVGWAVVSVGSVLILHSLALRRPGG